jgi:tetratricopeptide (TPR) repeat protein
LIDPLIVLLLILGTLGLYWQVRGFDFLRFDDPQYVTQNRLVQMGLTSSGIRYAFAGNVYGNWHPLTLLTEMLTVQLFSSSSAVMHLLCAGIHCTNAVLLFLFLRWTTGCRLRSALVAMLWAWHPLRAESVAWVGELKDVLCGFFWLISMLAFAWYRRRGSIGRYLLVVLTVAMALMSKSMAITLPAALFLLNFWPLRQAGESWNPRWWRRRILEQLPLLLLAIIVSIVAAHTQREAGWTGSVEKFPLELRITNGLFAYLRYVGKELLPINLGLIYPHPGMLGRSVPITNWLPAVVVLAIVTAIAWRCRCSKPFLIVGWLWFIGTLVPVIGLVQLGQAAMADRYTYLPSIGLTIAIVWTVAEIAAKNRRKLGIAGVFTCLAIVALTAASWRQISYWHDNYTLMDHSNAVIPDDFLAMSSLSMDENARGDTAAAIRLARSAVQLVPDNQEAHHALASALRSAGQVPEAFAEYKTAIKLDPSHVGLRLEFGQLLGSLNRTGDARGQFQRAVELDPQSAEARSDLAAALATEGDYNDAIAQWKIAVQLNPHFATAHGLLADALRIVGDRTGAIEHYRAALREGSTSPRWETNLAWESAIDPSTTPSQLAELVPIAAQACEQTQSKDAFALYAYSLTLARVGRFDDAIAAATTAEQAADVQHQDALAKAIRSRLAAYRVGKITN